MYEISPLDIVDMTDAEITTFEVMENIAEEYGVDAIRFELMTSSVSGKRSKPTELSVLILLIGIQTHIFL